MSLNHNAPSDHVRAFIRHWFHERYNRYPSSGEYKHLCANKPYELVQDLETFKADLPKHKTDNRWRAVKAATR